MIHKDTKEHRYREIGACPYSELTPGTPFRLPCCDEVYFRSQATPKDFSRIEATMPGIAAGLFKTRVLVLERVNDAEGEGQASIGRYAP